MLIGVIKASLGIAALVSVLFMLPPLPRLILAPTLGGLLYYKLADDPQTSLLRFGVRFLSPLLRWRTRNRRALMVDLETQVSSLLSSAPPKASATSSRLVCISDIHTLWDHIDIPSGDTLIIAGDLLLTDRSPEYYLSQFRDFLASQKQRFKEIVVIGGNHDLILQRLGTPETKKRLSPAFYLENESLTTADNITIFGSPWSAPEQKSYTAFQFRDGYEEDTYLEPMKALEPDSVDVLLTHSIGSEKSTSLLPLIQQLKPRIHVSGHYHSDRGVRFHGETLLINAASLNGLYLPMNPVVVVDMEKRK